MQSMGVLRFITALLISLFVTQAAGADTSKINLVFIGPLSGEGASIGQAMRDSAVLAYGRLAPEIQAKLRLKFEDDRLDPKQTISIFQRLAAENAVDVVTTFSSGTSKALAPISESKQIPLIAVASSPEISRNRSWSVNFWVTPETEAALVIKESQRRGYKKIARITSMQEGFISIREQVTKANQGALEIVLDEEYPVDIKDFKAFIAKAHRLPGLDAIMVLMMPGHVSVFAKQARLGGLKQPFIGFETFEDLGEVQAAEGALDGQWYVNADLGGQGFLKEYREAYPDGSLFGAGNAYDAVLLVGAAIGQGGRRAEINKFLHTVRDFSGAMGKFSASGDNRFTLKAAVMQVVKNGFERVPGAAE